MEGPESPAGMVEDTVKHHFDVAGMGLVKQDPQRCVAAKQGIDLHIVKGVIAVIGRRRKDGIQIQRCDAQPFEIIETIGYAIEVAALKALLVG